jgi:hypothetical protein
MLTPTFSICHATARVPDGWRASHDAWMANADDPGEVEYCLAVHADDLACIPADDLPNDMKLTAYYGARNSVHGWNVAAGHSRGQILILNADDFFPPPYWDSLIRDAIVEPAAAGRLIRPTPDIQYTLSGALQLAEFAIHVSTGNPNQSWDREHMALGIVSRPLYNRWGYALYPEYESMYSDVDMFEHARHDGVIVEAFDLVFEHRHVSFGKSPDDAVYQKQNRLEAYAIGRKVIARRRLDRFEK